MSDFRVRLQYAWSVWEVAVLGKTGEGDGQVTEVLGCLNVDVLLMVGGQQGAIRCLPK